MNAIPLVFAVLALVGCGAERGAAPPPEPARIAERPAEQPPTLEGQLDAPPLAWIETASGSYWLAYSSYCWARACADFVSAAERDDLPVVPVRRGEVVRFHLGFEPTEINVSYGSTDLGVREVTVGRDAAWRVSFEGTMVLFARSARGGDASYVAELEFR